MAKAAPPAGRLRGQRRARRSPRLTPPGPFPSSRRSSVVDPRADPHRAASPLRATGIEAVGPAPWGTHFCQFYGSPADLVEILVPYFKAGLEQDESCMWITSPPLGVREARAALARAVPDLDSYER